MATENVTKTKTVYLSRDLIRQLAAISMTSDDDKSSIGNVAIELNDSGDVITVRQTDGYRASVRKLRNYTGSFPSIESIRPSVSEKIAWARVKVADVKRLIDILKLDKVTKENKNPTTVLTFDVYRSVLTFEISNGASVTVPLEEGSLDQVQADPRVKIGYASRFLRECLSAALENGLKTYSYATIDLSWYGNLPKDAGLRPLIIESVMDNDVNEILLMPIRV